MYMAPITMPYVQNKDNDIQQKTCLIAEAGFCYRVLMNLIYNIKSCVTP